VCVSLTPPAIASIMGRKKITQSCNIIVAVITVAVFWWLVSTMFSPSSSSSSVSSTDDSFSKEFSGYRTCEKRTNVAFLKTHKCASSSLQNIFMRFGLKNELNFVLPSTGNYIGRYISYRRGMMADTDWERAGLTYNMFCLHTIWDRSEVSATLEPGAIHVTIVRDPVDLFESLWSYAAMNNYYHTDLNTFALAPKEGIFAGRAYRNLGRNQMLWDAGLPANMMDNITAVRAKIEEMDSGFHLVMLAERFDESMILLKDLLCWDYRDVVNFKLNARKESKKISLSSEARAALREYLAADYLLYDHFKAKFEALIDSFGLARMSRELSVLRKANSRMQSMCSVQATDNDKLELGENKLWGNGVVAYTADYNAHPDCRFFSLSELNFIDELRVVQSRRSLKNRIFKLLSPFSLSKTPSVGPSSGAKLMVGFI